MAIRFTMLLDDVLEKRVTDYQKGIEKMSGFSPQRTAIIRQSLEEYLDREEKKLKKSNTP